MDSKRESLRRAVALLVAGVVYLGLVAATFVSGIDLAADRTMQYIVHFVVIVTAIVYVLFAEAVCRTEEGRERGRMLLVFAALFCVPVVVGRGLGIYAVSAPLPEIWNFYGPVSVSRAIEMISWTLLFPLSMLYLARIFFGRKQRLAGVLCVASAACCLTAFASLISPKPVFTMIGVMGWGVLFLVIIILYMAGLKKTKETPAV
jgi:MFS family permease